MFGQTLPQQIGRRIILIVAALSLLLSAATFVTVRTVTYDQLDAQLDAAFARQQRSEERGEAAPGITEPGMPLGTIVVLQTHSGDLFGSVVVEGGYEPLTFEAAETVFSLAPGSGKQTVQVPDMGRYRAEVQVTEQAVVGVALPLSDTDHTLERIAVFAVVATAIAIMVSTVATRVVARRVTYPLRALSTTAGQMSEMKLDQGDVALPEPIPTHGLPPEHEVAQLTTAFNLMVRNVQSALAARQASESTLRRFVADASHELRNPLAAIKGYAELAQRAEGPDRDFALGRIDAETTRLTNLVNDLLLLARLDADTTPPLKAVDVVEVALNGVSDARAAGPDHLWQLELPEVGFEVRANHDQLHQVVVNLLANARTHTPAGTKVVTTVGIRDGWGCLVVSDDGPGIPPEVLPHVFERFSRADQSRAHTSHRSTGLGLAIVAAVTASFGGKATVNSRPGHTEFTVWLPLA